MANRERARGILERNDAVSVSRELSNVRVLLELKLWSEACRGRGKTKLDAAQVRVRDLQVHVTAELEVVEPAFAKELQVQELLDHDVDAVRMECQTS